ncbi:hypothetical protein [Leifsonia sp. RAF41]|uniref:SLAC1 family transporter n=1 Tax=Leifsonia sp. RAF41 TaxID=3233056 RepID=UPI003F9DE901
MATQSAARPRLPLNTFSIAFGLSGLAGTWTAATTVLNSPRSIGEILWILAALVWISTIVRYVATARSAHAAMADAKDPVLGPFASLVPATGSLLSGHLVSIARTPGSIGVWICFIATVGFGVWFVARLMSVPREQGALHGGYLLPTVAASLIASQSLAGVGAPTLATAVFGVGLLFWALIGSILLARFMTGPAVPGPLLPTLAVFSAPPAVAGNAWWAMNGAEASTEITLLTGVMVALLIPHAFLIRRYIALPFAVGFWALTFAAASSATFSIRVLSLASGPWVTPVSWLVVAAATAIVATIGIRTVLGHRPRARRLTSTTEKIASPVS